MLIQNLNRRHGMDAVTSKYDLSAGQIRSAPHRSLFGFDTVVSCIHSAHITSFCGVSPEIIVAWHPRLRKYHAVYDERHLEQLTSAAASSPSKTALGANFIRACSCQDSALEVCARANKPNYLS